MKTLEFVLLVHASVNGTPVSPAMGVDTAYGKLWGRDESHLRKLIRFVFGANPVFVDRKLDNATVSPAVMRKYGLSAAK